MKKVLMTAVLALASVAALAGCRAAGEVDPDGNVSTSVPAVR